MHFFPFLSFIRVYWLQSAGHAGSKMLLQHMPSVVSWRCSL